MVETFADFTVYFLDVLIFASFVYLAVRGAVWLRAWHRRRPRRIKVDRDVVRLERVRQREASQVARSKGAAYCSECGFPLARKSTSACPFCAVVFEATS